MADVQTEKGFTKIANELFDKIIQTDFNKRELKVILLIIRYTYGFSRKQAPLSVRFISQATGVPFTHITPVIKKLAANNIIKIPTDYSTGNSPRIIALNKDFDLWTVKSTQNGNSTQIGNCYQNGYSKVPKTGTLKVPKTVTKKEIKENIKKAGIQISEIVIPETLKNIPGFMETWKEWLSYRKELKKELTARSQGLQLKNLMKWNNSGYDVIQIINNSMMNGWQGLFPPKGVNSVKPKPKKEQTDTQEFIRNNPGYTYD